MACELGQYGIRCNSMCVVRPPSRTLPSADAKSPPPGSSGSSSPGHITTNQTLPLLAAKPELGRAWADANPLGRLGEIHELRGVVAWLASSASSFATGSDILVSGACAPIRAEGVPYGLADALLLRRWSPRVVALVSIIYSYRLPIARLPRCAGPAHSAVSFPARGARRTRTCARRLAGGALISSISRTTNDRRSRVD